MKADKIYNHLNAREYLIVNHPALWDELLNAIKSIDANKFLKYSKDKNKKGEVLYSQTDINDEFQRLLYPKGWRSTETPYYVTDDPEITKELVKIKEKGNQKSFLESKKRIALETKNQVDFVKEKIAIEVQFGKYFSVAYDLHVKHTFFYSLDTINVGIEIIPTHEFMLRMDTGVSWWENEVTNVIREGRSNPSVPIIVIGIEPDNLIPLPDKSSSQKVQIAKNRRDRAQLSLKEAKNNVASIKKTLSQETSLKKQSSLTARLAKAQERQKKAQGIFDKAEDLYKEAKEKHKTLKDFKTKSAPIIDDLNKNRKKRRDEIKDILQESARKERVEQENI